MGLFSRKKKTYVSSVSYNLSKDSETNYLQSVVINSILSTQSGSLAEDMRGSYLNGQGMRLKQAYRYGRDHYALGLPSSSVVTGDVSVDDVTPTLRAIAGKEVLVTEVYIGSPDYAFWVYQYLADHYGYDESTNTFANPPDGVPAEGNIVDSDISQTGLVQVIITTPSGSKQGLSFTVQIDNLRSYLYAPYRGVNDAVVTKQTSQAVYKDGDAESDSTVSTTSTQNGVTTTTAVRTQVTIDEAQTTTTTVTTKTVGVTDRVKYFIYKLGSGTYPALDKLQATANLASPYYPWVVMRDNNKDLTSAQYQNTAQYKTSKKLLTKAGLSMTDLARSINTNKNIGDVDFAFIHFGIALNTKVNESKEYLFQFFSYLMAHQRYSKLDWELWKSRYNDYVKERQEQGKYVYGNVARIMQPGTNSLSIRYNNENWYNVTLSWQYINLTTVNRVIGKVGHIEITCQKDDVEYTIYSDAQDTIEQYTVQATPMRITKQVSATQCEVLEIVGAQHDNRVYNGKSVTTSAAKGVSGDEDGDSNFIVPLNRQVFDQMGIVDITQTCYDCMHITFNSYKTVKQKWYQTSIFKVVVIVIAIVVTIASFGSLSAPAAAVASAAAAAGASAGVALAVGIGTQIAIGVAASIVLRQIARYVAPEVFAIIAVATLAYGAYAAGSSYAATGEVSLSTDLMSSQALLASMNASVSGYQMSMQYKTLDVAEQIRRNAAEYTSRMDDVNAAMKTLDTASHEVDLMQLQSSYFTVFESPSSFITRTTNPINAISMVTGQVNSYVDNALNIGSNFLR